jgi:hypothetical protein
MQEISSLAQGLFTSQEGFCSMELVSSYKANYVPEMWAKVITLNFCVINGKTM